MGRPRDGPLGRG